MSAGRLDGCYAGGLPLVPYPKRCSMRLPRIPVCVALVTAGLLVAGVAAQEGEKTNVPTKGETILVKGCLQGPLLLATETRALDETGTLSTALTYQLKGKKDTLKQLREKFDGRLVEVTGVLKSTLPQPNATRDVRVGKTRIAVGMGAPPQDRMAAGVNESLPVLEVKSFDGSMVSCGG